MTRGEIYYIKSDKAIDGVKKANLSMGVIVSNEMLNALGEHVEIVYMNEGQLDNMPTHVTVRPHLSTRNMNTPFIVQCEKIFTIRQDRIGLGIGALRAEELRSVDAALAISLGLEPEPMELDLFGGRQTVEVERVVEKVVMREPTEEELDKLLDERANKRFEEALKEAQRTPATIMPDIPAASNNDPLDYPITMQRYDLIRLEIERDTWRSMFHELLDHMTAAVMEARA